MDKISDNIEKFLDYLNFPVRVNIKEIKEGYDRLELRDQALIGFFTVISFIYLISFI